MLHYKAGNLDTKDYWETDKTMTKEIMDQFAGQSTTVTCHYCKNDPDKVKGCQECNGDGSYEIIYSTTETNSS